MSQELEPLTGPARLAVATWPATMRDFLSRALPVFVADARVVNVAAGGSAIVGQMDAFSDLDLVIAVEPSAFAEVMTQREAIAATFGELVASFTGEHVGEPRLLICLYASGPLHVDLKFVSLPDVNPRVEDPLVLWERDGRLTAELRRGTARFPGPDLHRIEERFWMWVHYGAVKIGRGELFEALALLDWLRVQVLGPLLLAEAGARPSGVRRVETAAPSRAAELAATVAGLDAADCARALRASIGLYRSLRTSVAPADFRPAVAAEAVACAYLDVIAAGAGRAG